MSALGALVALPFALRLYTRVGKFKTREGERESMARNTKDGATSAPSAPSAPSTTMADILCRFMAGPATPERQEPDAPTADELFEERAAIREYDGGLSREDAEILARHDVASELSPTTDRQP